MKPKIPAILLLTVIATLFIGCASTPTRYGKSEVNVLNLVRVENQTYSEVGPLTIGVKTSEMVTRTAPSGGRIRFLWGLFTIADD